VINRRVAILTAVALVMSMFAMASTVLGVKKDAPEGCTPGYWGRSQHFDSYPAGVSPSSLLEATIGFADPNNRVSNSLTFGTAINTTAGPFNQLLRHGAAAWLNARVGLDSVYTTDEVRDALSAALATGGDIEGTKDDFDDANNRDCVLN
jgi:hypothetical protein